MVEYQDMEGNACTLNQLVRREPEWAASRIAKFQWRSVEEEQPEICQWYLVWVKSGVGVGGYVTTDNWRDGWEIDGVTHWMPQPEPPQE